MGTQPKNRKKKKSVFKTKKDFPCPFICLSKLNCMLYHLPEIKRWKSHPTQLLVPNPRKTKMKGQQTAENVKQPNKQRKCCHSASFHETPGLSPAPPSAVSAGDSYGTHACVTSRVAVHRPAQALQLANALLLIWAAPFHCLSKTLDSAQMVNAAAK